MAQRDAAGYSIIDDVPECRDAVTALLQQPLVAVDAEGVAMGRPGPVTLIQVAMGNGHVYLFDVYRRGRPTPKMFSHGGLKEFLESPDVIKVMHSCSNDSYVLNSQYAVTLDNVFDIQVAQNLLDESSGRQLPRFKTLQEVCSLYLADTSLLESKGDVQAKWRLEDAEFWARRPFTQEMIHYACADVRLISEVYRKQSTLLRERNLEAVIEARVRQELVFRLDPSVRAAALQRRRDKVTALIRQIEVRYPQNVELSWLEEDELEALSWLRNPERHSRTIQSLKRQYFMKEFAQIWEALQKEGRNFIISSWQYSFLDFLRDHRDKSIQTEARKLLEQVENLEVAHMSTKYRLDTPLEHVSEQDQKILSSLSLGNDCSPVLRRLVGLVRGEQRWM